MTRTNHVQTSFRNGQRAAFSQGRADQEDYYSALNLCADYLPVDAGALIRRSGSAFVATVDALQGGTVPFVDLIPYNTDDGAHHVCVLMPTKMQFFSTGTFDFEGASIAVASVDKGSPVTVTTAVVHGLSVGDLITFLPVTDADISGAVSMVNVQLRVTSVPTTTTFTAEFAGAREGEGDVNGDDLCWHGGSIGLISGITLPYTVSDLTTGGGVKFTQDHANLYLFSKNHETQMIREELTAVEMVLEDGPYKPVNKTTTTLGFSGTTGSVTVTASAVVGINKGDIGFQTTDIGRVIRVQDPAGDWTWLRITARTSTTVVTALIEGGDLSATTAVETWRLGLYSDTTGHPTHGVFHAGRLWLCSDAQTGRLDGSAILPFDDTPTFFSFSPTAVDGTVADDNAVAAIFLSEGRNRITWLSVDDTGLKAGSSDGAWIIQASALDDPITPTSIDARRKSRFKSSDALPATVNRSTIFVGNLEREVIELRRYEGGFDAKNVSRDGEDLTAPGLAELVYANAPIPILWARTNDKQLIGACFRRDVDGEQTGWHQHNLTHTLDPDKTAPVGKLEAITVMQQSDKDASNIDTLWLCVERNGNFCLEYMTPFFDQSRIELEGFFADSAVSYDQSNFSSAWNRTGTNEYTFYGLHHLNGDEVDIVFRTLDMGTQTVANGKVSVDIPPEALILDSSFSTFLDSDNDTWFIVDYDRVFTTGLVSSSQSGNIAPPPNGAVYLDGEDGETYYITMGSSGSDTILVDKNTGTETVVLQPADLLALINEKGMNPTGDIQLGAFGGTKTGTSFCLPGTPYFVTIASFDPGPGFSPNFSLAVLYWKVNSPTDVVSVGGFIDSSRTSFENIGGHEEHIAFTYLGDGLASLVNDFLLCWQPSGAAPPPQIARLPSVTDITGVYVPWVDGVNLWSDRVTEVSEWGDGFLETTFAGPTIDTRMNNRAHFLPTTRGDGTGVYLAAHMNRDFAQADIAGTLTISTPYSLATATDHPDGYTTSVIYTPTVGGKGGSVSSAELLNCRFRDTEANAILPFDDAGFNSLDVRDSSADDYWNPSVYPTDPTNHLKPWLIFYPKSYYSADTIDTEGTFLDIRVFQWSPVSGTATELEHLEGVLFNINTEFAVSNVQNLMQNVLVAWDQVSGEIEVLIDYNKAANPLPTTTTISSFGTLIVDVADDSTDIRRQEALNRGFDAIVGLNYRSKFQLLRPQNGSQAGPDLGKHRQLDQFATQVHRTGPYRVGTEFDWMDDIVAETSVEASGRRPLFSGVFRGTVSDNTEDTQYDGELAISQDRPGPGTFLAVGVFKNTQDG